MNVIREVEAENGEELEWLAKNRNARPNVYLSTINADDVNNLFYL